MLQDFKLREKSFICYALRNFDEFLSSFYLSFCAQGNRQRMVERGTHYLFLSSTQTWAHVSSTHSMCIFSLSLSFIPDTYNHMPQTFTHHSIHTYSTRIHTYNTSVHTQHKHSHTAQIFTYT